MQVRTLRRATRCIRCDCFDLGVAGELNVLSERRFKKLRSILDLGSKAIIAAR